MVSSSALAKAMDKKNVEKKGEAKKKRPDAQVKSVFPSLEFYLLLQIDIYHQQVSEGVVEIAASEDDPEEVLY